MNYPTFKNKIKIGSPKTNSTIVSTTSSTTDTQYYRKCFFCGHCVHNRETSPAFMLIVRYVARTFVLLLSAVVSSKPLVQVYRQMCTLYHLYYDFETVTLEALIVTGNRISFINEDFANLAEIKKSRFAR